jgi:hypothetical protein
MTQVPELAAFLGLLVNIDVHEFASVIDEIPECIAKHPQAVILMSPRDSVLVKPIPICLPFRKMVVVRMIDDGESMAVRELFLPGLVGFRSRKNVVLVKDDSLIADSRKDGIRNVKRMVS